MSNLRLLAILCLMLILAGPGAPARGEPGASPPTLTGRVLDSSGRPVADVRILVAETGRSTASGEDGRFTLSELAPGRYTISASRSGYAPKSQALLLGRVQEIEIVLEATPFPMQPLEVTGTRAPMDPRESPLATAALAGDAVRLEHSVSIAHATEGLPGLRTLSTGAEIGKPVIRGLAGSRVLVLDNGHRLEDYSWSDEDGPSIDVRQVDRVEVIRGPASIMYGSDALGGVVNAVSEELPDAKGSAPILRGGFETYAASNDAEFGGALRLEGAKGATGWRVLGVGRYGNNLHTPGGELENTGFFAVNGEASAGRRGERGGLGIRIAHYGGEFHLLEAGGPAGGASAKAEEGGPVRKLDDIRVQLDSNRLLGGMRFELKSQFQRHSLAEVSDEALPPPPRGAIAKKVEPKAFDLLLNTFSIDLMAEHGEGPWQGTVGASGSFQKNDTRGPIPLVPDATIGSGGAFAFERANVGRVGLLGGLRIDRRHTSADANAQMGLPDQSRDYTEVSGNAGAVYRILEVLSVTGNVSRGWRAPNLFELFANGPHIGEARYEMGKADLEPERSLSLDAGARLQSGRLRAGISGFRSRVDRFIYITPTDSLIGDLRVYHYEQAEALLYGGEASAEVEVVHPLTVRGTVDYVRGDNKEVNEPLPLMPPLRGTLRADLRPENTGWLRHSYLGAEVQVFAKQTRLSEFDYATPGYALLNADAGVEHALGGRAWRFDLALRNAANVRYKSFLSRYKEFAYDPGRNVILRLSTGI